jgi:thiamine pyrophosphate-dependent acetolactate synthase large subunit-like protein
VPQTSNSDQPQLPGEPSLKEGGERAAVSVRRAVIELLDAFGMQAIFGNPGSTELPMFRDLPAKFRYVLGLQESVVVGMADGYAQATRNAAFVNLHGRHFGLPRVVGTDLPEINFCDLARGQGCRAIRVERVTELDEALKGFNAPGPTLIEVVVAQKD